MAMEQPFKPKAGGGTGGGGPGTTGDTVQKSRNYLEQVIVELKKTTWPTKPEASRLTVVVIVVIAVLGVYMGLLDYVLSAVVTKFSLIK